MVEVITYGGGKTPNLLRTVLYTNKEEEMIMKILKSIVILCCITAMLVGIVPVLAQDDNVIPREYLDSEGQRDIQVATVYLDGKEMVFDVPAQIINDRTMVPMRAIFEAFEADVKWDGSTQTVTAIKGETKIVLTIGSSTAYVGENAITLDVPAMLINDRTLVPLRFVSESLGADVQWDGEKKAVTITTKKEEPAEVKWPYWEQDIIDSAVKAANISLPLDEKYAWKSTLEISEAFYIMSLMSYYNPTLKDSNGKKVVERVVEQIRSLIIGGHEPSCVGGLGGWIDNPTAQALAMAKNTPAVWSQLTADEIAKCDFIMKALTVVGNYTHNYQNNPKSEMTQITWWEKGWNPNHVEGYVGVMIAAHIYFGGDKVVNAFLKEFKYDDYIKQMDTYGFVNMKSNYEKAGKQLMEKGGTDGKGGSITGVKMPFTYRDILSGDELKYDPMALYVSLAKRMYYHPVVSVIYDTDGVTVRGSIVDGSKSPYEGQIGMAYEFKSVDASGIRTSADYFVHGFRNSIVTRATLEALGYWKGKDVADIEKRMLVGVEDFYYKVGIGYNGWSNGKDLGVQSEKTHFKGMGYQYMKAMWYTAVKEKPVAEK